MTERPILFSAPMVRAILDGSKTQTRRIVNMDTLRVRLPRAVHSDLAFLSVLDGDRPLVANAGTHHAIIHERGAVSVRVGDRTLGVKPGEFHLVCPYADGDTHLAMPADAWKIAPCNSRLWVRETFRAGGSGNRETVGLDNSIHYRADLDEPKAPGCWKSSIFMRRRESRITLAVESVRVERLQAITEADARAEGVRAAAGSYAAGFKAAWNNINEDRAPWSANPWVWVIGFSRVKP